MDQPYAVRGESHLMGVQVSMTAGDSATNHFVAPHADVVEDVYSVVKWSEEPYFDLGGAMLLALSRRTFAHGELHEPGVVKRLPRVQREVTRVGRERCHMRRQSVAYGLYVTAVRVEIDDALAENVFHDAAPNLLQSGVAPQVRRRT